MTDKSRYLLMYEQQMLFVAHKIENMSSKARYLLTGEQQMMFVAHKMENMSNKTSFLTHHSPLITASPLNYV